MKLNQKKSISLQNKKNKAHKNKRNIELLMEFNPGLQKYEPVLHIKKVKKR